jgi:hypothetical protein
LTATTQLNRLILAVAAEYSLAVAAVAIDAI